MCMRCLCVCNHVYAVCACVHACVSVLGNEDVMAWDLLSPLRGPRVTRGFPSQRTSDVGFEGFSDITLNKLLNSRSADNLTRHDAHMTSIMIRREWNWAITNLEFLSIGLSTNFMGNMKTFLWENTFGIVGHLFVKLTPFGPVAPCGDIDLSTLAQVVAYCLTISVHQMSLKIAL